MSDDEVAAEAVERAFEALEDVMSDLLVAGIFLGPEDPLGADALWLADAVEAEVATASTILARLQQRQARA